jgi:hypothetical protein
MAGYSPDTFAAKSGISAAILRDAGVGRERAGIAALSYLDNLGVQGGFGGLGAAAASYWIVVEVAVVVEAVAV